MVILNHKTSHKTSWSGIKLCKIFSMHFLSPLVSLSKMDTNLKLISKIIGPKFPL